MAPHLDTPLSLVKCLYIFLRIMTVVAMADLIWQWTGEFTPAECEKRYYLQAGLATPALVTSEALFSLRVYAVSNSRWVGLFLFVQWLGYVAFEIVVCAIGLTFLPVFNFAQRDYCIAAGGPHGNMALYFWVAPLITISTSMALMFWGLRRFMNVGLGLTGILRTLVSEGVSYFLLVLVVNITNIALFSSASAYNTINSPFTVAITSLAACRLVLDLHQRHDRAPPGSARGNTGSFWVGRSAVHVPPTFGSEHRSTGSRSKLPVGTFALGSVGLDSAGGGGETHMSVAGGHNPLPYRVAEKRIDDDGIAVKLEPGATRNFAGSDKVGNFA